MGIEDLRGLSAIFCLLAFAAVVWWAFAPSRKGYFERAAELPFAEDEKEQEKNT